MDRGPHFWSGETNVWPDAYSSVPHVARDGPG